MNIITHLLIIKDRRCIHNNNRDLRKQTIQDICKKHLVILASHHNNNNILTINNKTKDIYMSNKRDNSKLNKIKTRLYINRYYNNNNNN